MSDTPNSSYSRIAKTTALLGGSSVVNICLGIIRTKVFALQLGPALFGVMGLYTAITGMIQGIASLGLGQSAVREIAEAAGSQDDLRIAKTIRAYRRMVFLTGLCGLLMTLCAALPSSWWTFGNFDHAWAIAALALVVFCAELQAGQIALLQGLRRIKELTALTITGALWSTLLAIPILVLFRQRGIVPFLIAVGAGQVVASWWYARRVKIVPIQITWRETWAQSRGMLSLGLTFVATGVAGTASVYVIRIIIQRFVGEAGVGLYQSAFNISGVYVGFILQAMSGDYYPRLAAAGGDVESRNRLVNEQAEMALLVAVPGLVSALVFSDLLIWLLYSGRFAGASEILRWQVLGMLGRIISWPLGFIVLARADKRTFLWIEVSSALVHVGLVFVGTKFFGVVGAGAGFAGLYLLFVGLIYWVVKIRHGFSWHRNTRNMVVLGTLAVGLAFATTFVGNAAWRIAFGTMALLPVSTMCVHGLVRRIGARKIGDVLMNCRVRLGLARG